MQVFWQKFCEEYITDETLFTVLVGGSHRFASTHRVSRREGHTYQYLHQKIQSVLNEVSLCSSFELCML